MKRIPNDLIQTLRDKQLTLALAESITCGLAAAKLSSCIGVSDVLITSLVCYTPQAKMDLLRVEKSTIDKHTCESPEVTEQMAQHLSKIIRADIYAAITGLASSDGSETKAKPVGTVFFSIVYKGKTHAFKYVFNGSPLEVKKKACIKLYELILEKVG